jgi:hypothetical protein
MTDGNDSIVDLGRDQEVEDRQGRGRNRAGSVPRERLLDARSDHSVARNTEDDQKEEESEQPKGTRWPLAALAILVAIAVIGRNDLLVSHEGSGKYRRCLHRRPSGDDIAACCWLRNGAGSG